MKKREAYLADGVYMEMVDPTTIRFWTERTISVIGHDGKNKITPHVHEIYIEKDMLAWALHWANLPDDKKN